jgi:hypothetical protein
VVDEDDLLGVEQALGDRRTDDVVGDHPANAADDVDVALTQPKHAVDAQAGVHAGHHGHLAGGRHRQVPLSELLDALHADGDLDAVREPSRWRELLEAAQQMAPAAMRGGPHAVGPSGPG